MSVHMNFKELVSSCLRCYVSWRDVINLSNRGPIPELKNNSEESLLIPLPHTTANAVQKFPLPDSSTQVLLTRQFRLSPGGTTLWILSTELRMNWLLSFTSLGGDKQLQDIYLNNLHSTPYRDCLKIQNQMIHHYVLKNSSIKYPYHCFFWDISIDVFSSFHQLQNHFW